ncbi:MAG: hypothetical protein IK066_02630 [Kiritimatiellae bacterium]|nr:hypothetical protein [Kiritimatiellia bacterium]
MPEELKNVFLEGMKVSVESFIRSRPSERERELISAASECLRLGLPLNEAEILGRCRRIRYSGKAGR